MPGVDVLWLLPWSLAAAGVAMLADAVITYVYERREYTQPAPPAPIDVRVVE
jgi:uncharacterized membrane protein